MSRHSTHFKSSVRIGVSLGDCLGDFALTDMSMYAVKPLLKSVHRVLHKSVYIVSRRYRRSPLEFGATSFELHDSLTLCRFKYVIIADTKIPSEPRRNVNVPPLYMVNDLLRLPRCVIVTWSM